MCSGFTYSLSLHKEVVLLLWRAEGTVWSAGGVTLLAFGVSILNIRWQNF
jgi:hypothetical protein